MNQFTVTSGSDVRLTITVSNDDGPLNLTGRSINLLNVSPRLADLIQAPILDAAAGEISVFIEGTLPIPAGVYFFRVQIAGVGDSLGLPLLSMKVV